MTTVFVDEQQVFVTVYEGNHLLTWRADPCS